jgi:hypothetical protein
MEEILRSFRERVKARTSSTVMTVEELLKLERQPGQALPEAIPWCLVDVVQVHEEVDVFETPAEAATVHGL